MDIGDSSYIIFANDTFTQPASETSITESTTFYAKLLFDFKGYMVRIADNHGLRAIYDYDMSTFKALDDYTVLEVGVLGAKKTGDQAICYS